MTRYSKTGIAWWGLFRLGGAGRVGSGTSQKVTVGLGVAGEDGLVTAALGKARHGRLGNGQKAES
jgi:hypothetical protein